MEAVPHRTSFRVAQQRRVAVPHQTSLSRSLAQRCHSAVAVPLAHSRILIRDTPQTGATKGVGRGALVRFTVLKVDGCGSIAPDASSSTALGLEDSTC